MTAHEIKASEIEAKSMKEDINTFELAKKVAKKNRYPNIHWRDHPNYD